jgi:hypothetical protein
MKIKKFEDLSNDIVVLAKLEDGTFKKIEEPINILQVTGLITDPEEIKKIQEAFTMDTSLVVKDIKRGDILWLTCLLEKTNTQSRNAQNWGVVQVRVVNYYWGLNKLNTIKKNTNK